MNLFAGRISTGKIASNQHRLDFSTFAYTLAALLAGRGPRWDTL